MLQMKIMPLFTDDPVITLIRWKSQFFLGKKQYITVRPSAVIFLEIVSIDLQRFLKLKMKNTYPIINVPDEITLDLSNRHILEENGNYLQRINQKMFPQIRDMFKMEKGVWFNVTQDVEAITA